MADVLRTISREAERARTSTRRESEQVSTSLSTSAKKAEEAVKAESLRSGKRVSGAYDQPLEEISKSIVIQKRRRELLGPSAAPLKPLREARAGLEEERSITLGRIAASKAAALVGIGEQVAAGEKAIATSEIAALGEISAWESAETRKAKRAIREAARVEDVVPISVEVVETFLPVEGVAGDTTTTTREVPVEILSASGGRFQIKNTETGVTSWVKPSEIGLTQGDYALEDTRQRMIRDKVIVDKNIDIDKGLRYGYEASDLIALGASQASIDEVKWLKAHPDYEVVPVTPLRDRVYVRDPKTGEERWISTSESEATRIMEFVLHPPTPEVVEVIEVGGKTFTPEDWEAKSKYEQVKLILGRAPSLGEVTGYIGGEAPRYSGFNYDVPILGALISGTRLGVEYILPGTQSPLEEYMKRVGPEAYEQYYLGTYGYIPSATVMVGEQFIPGVRAIAGPGITREEVTGGEYLQTAFGLTVAAFPFARLGWNRLVTPRLVDVPSIKVTLQKPWQTVSEGFYKKTTAQFPVDIKITKGLQRAGVSTELEKAAFTSQRAQTSLAQVEIAAKRAPVFDVRSSAALQKAQQAVKVADEGFLSALGRSSLTTRQIRLVEQVSGYKGLGSALKEYTAASKAFTSLEGRLIKGKPTPETTTAAQVAKTRLTQAQTNLQNVMQPRFKFGPTTEFRGYGMRWGESYGGYLPEGPTPSGGPTPTQQMLLRYKPMTPEGTKAALEAQARSEAAYYARSGVRPLVPITTPRGGVAVAERTQVDMFTDLFPYKARTVSILRTPALYGEVPTLARTFGMSALRSGGLATPTYLAGLLPTQTDVLVAPTTVERLVEKTTPQVVPDLVIQPIATTQTLLEGSLKTFKQVVPGSIATTFVGKLQQLVPISDIAASKVSPIMAPKVVAPVTSVAPATGVAPITRLQPKPTTSLEAETMKRMQTRIQPTTLPITGIETSTKVVPIAQAATVVTAKVEPLTRTDVRTRLAALVSPMLKTVTKTGIRVPPPIPVLDGEVEKKKPAPTLDGLPLVASRSQGMGWRDFYTDTEDVKARWRPDPNAGPPKLQVWNNPGGIVIREDMGISDVRMDLDTGKVGFASDKYGLTDFGTRNPSTTKGMSIHKKSTMLRMNI